jgi:ketosteroid isomerase-like protein
MIRLVFVFSIFLHVACSDTGVDQVSEAEALMELSREWSDVEASGDVVAGIDYWSADALLLAPGLPIFAGKPAIREYIEGAASIPGFKISWQPQQAVVSKSGDMAYMLEANIIEFDDVQGNHVVNHGKVLTVWRKTSKEEWKNVVDMWNSTPSSSN